MKVKALRAFWMEDLKRGMMIERNVGDEFVMDESEEGETIHGLLGGGRITIIDEKFIPAKGQYLAIHSFPYKTVDGFQRTASAGKEVSLTQEVACTLLTSGHIQRLSDNEWSPRKLLQANVKGKEAIKMFDDEPPVKAENSWLRGRR